MFYQKKNGLFFLGIFIFVFLFSTCGNVFSSEVTLLPSLKVAGEYDSNITFERTDEIDDYSAIFSPGLNFGYTTELLTVRSQALVDVFRYFDETDFDTENQFYSLGAEYKLTERWNVSTSGSFRKDTTLDSYLDETGRVTERKDRERFDIEGQTFFKATVLDEFGLGYRYGNVDFSGNDGVDYDTHLVTLVYNRFFNDFQDNSIVQTSYEYRETDEKEIEVYVFSLGWRHDFSQTLTGRALLGGRYLDVSYKDDRDDFDNWGGDIDISLIKKWETTSGTIGYQRGLRNAAEGEVVEVNKFYCDIQKMIYQRLGAGFRGQLFFTSEENDENSDKDTRYFLLNPSLFYKLTENHLLRLAYSYANEDDDSVDNDSIRDRHRVLLGLEFNFPFKW
jgi:hypothetical protein